jgi:hypothetical protein
MLNEYHEYECDKCEEVIDDMSGCVEVRYGFICTTCWDYE